ncbi:MAG: hypothetical protein ACRDPY_15545 [Streptosporangiaceae bacterium]
MTDAQLADGKVETHIEYNGQARMFTEEPWQVFGAIRVTGATLVGVGFGNGNIYYMLGEVDQAYVPAGFLQASWLERDGRMRTLTGARLAGDGVDYEVLDAGRAGVLHETAESVLRNLRITGVRLTGTEFKDGSAYFTLASSG